MKLGPGEQVIIKNIRTREYSYVYISEMFDSLGCLVCFGGLSGHQIYIPATVHGRMDIPPRLSCFVVCPKDPNALVELWTAVHKGPPLYVVESPQAVVGIPILLRSYPIPPRPPMDKDSMVNRAVEMVKEFRGVDIN